MTTLTVPEQYIPTMRTELLSILSADADDLSGCDVAADSEPAVEKCREIVGKINALAAALDTLGWVEGENGCGDAMLELEPPVLSYVVAELVDGASPARVGDRHAQGWVAWLSDVQDQFEAVAV